MEKYVLSSILHTNYSDKVISPACWVRWIVSKKKKEKGLAWDFLNCRYKQKSNITRKHMGGNKKWGQIILVKPDKH